MADIVPSGGGGGLGALSLDLRANAVQLNQQINITVRKVRVFVVNVTDNVKRMAKETKTATEQAAEGIKKMSDSMDRSMNSLLVIGMGLDRMVSSPLMRLAANAVETGNAFEASMIKTQGLVGIAAEQVQQWSKELRAMAPALGKTPVELAEGMYFVTTGGMRGAQAMEVLTESAKASAAGLGTTAKVADAVTSAINAYGREGLSAARATDIITAAVREGKFEASGLAAVIGRVLPLAAKMGVSFEQAAGVMAALTKTGMTVQQAGVSLQAMLGGLLKPTVEAEGILAKYGFSAAQLRNEIQGSNGLVNVLRKLQDAFGGNEETMGQVFSDLRELRGVFNLLAQDGKSVDSMLDGVTNSFGDAQRAFDAMTGTTAYKFHQAWVAVQGVLTEAGMAIAGVLLPAVQGIISVAKSASDSIQSMGDTTKKIIVVVGSLAIAMGPVVIATAIIGKAFVFLAPTAIMLAAKVSVLVGVFKGFMALTVAARLYAVATASQVAAGAMAAYRFATSLTAASLAATVAATKAATVATAANAATTTVAAAKTLALATAAKAAAAFTTTMNLALAATTAVAVVGLTAAFFVLVDVMSGASKSWREFNEEMDRSKKLSDDLSKAKTATFGNQMKAIDELKNPLDKIAKLEETLASKRKALAGANKAIEAQEARSASASGTGNTVMSYVPLIGRGFTMNMKLEEDRLKDMKASAANTAKEVSDLTNKLNAAKTAAKGVPSHIFDTMQDKVDELNDKLMLQINTFGMSEREVGVYKLALGGATDEQLSLSRAMEDYLQVMDENRKKVKDAESVVKKTLTPQQKFKEAVADLDDMLARGSITVEQYAQAYAHTKNELMGVNKELQKFDAASSTSAEGMARVTAFLDKSAVARPDVAAAVAKKKSLPDNLFDAQQRMFDEMFGPVTNSPPGVEELKNVAGILGAPLANLPGVNTKTALGILGALNPARSQTDPHANLNPELLPKDFKLPPPREKTPWEKMLGALEKIAKTNEAMAEQGKNVDIGPANIAG